MTLDMTLDAMLSRIVPESSDRERQRQHERHVHRTDHQTWKYVEGNSTHWPPFRSPLASAYAELSHVMS